MTKRLPLVLLLLVACSPEPATVAPHAGQPALYDADDFWYLVRNPSEISSADLLALGTPYLADELEGQLSLENADVDLRDTTIYALRDEANDDPRLENLQRVHAGILARHGRRELTSELADLRTRYLEQNDAGDRYYADASFRLRGRFTEGWGFDVPGLGEDLELRTRVGFNAWATLEARTVRVFDDRVDAHLETPLAAIRESAGFVLPRSVADLRDLKPGESVAIAGQGSLGINLGASAPIFAADPTGGLTWSIAFSASARAQLQGQVDVQIARMEGDELVVDLGISDMYDYGFRVAIEDRWGAAGLVTDRVDLDVGPIELGEIAEKAFEKELNRRLSLSASLSETNRSSRLSVLRFRFDLSRAGADEELETALAQLMQADARLAQLLAAQDHPGIVAEFQAHHGGMTRTAYAGVDLLGLRFFQETIEREGEIATRTEDGLEVIIYDALEQGRGWFSAERRFGRVGISSLALGERGVDGDVNLYLRVDERGAAVSREAILDNLGGGIIALVGPAPLNAIEEYAASLQDAAEAECYPTRHGPRANNANRRPANSCFEGLLATPSIQSGLIAAARAFETALDTANVHDEETRALATELAGSWMALHAVQEVGALFGEDSVHRFEARFDDEALRQLMEVPSSGLRTALIDYLAEAGMSRHRVYSDANERVEDENDAALDALERVWERHRQEYLTLAKAEEMELPNGHVLGDALMVRVPTRGDLISYADAMVGSFPQRRAEVAMALVDELVTTGEALDSTIFLDIHGVREEEAVTYALASLSDPNHRRIHVHHYLGGHRREVLQEAGLTDVRTTMVGEDVEWIGDAVFNLPGLFGF